MTGTGRPRRRRASSSPLPADADPRAPRRTRLGWPTPAQVPPPPPTCAILFGTLLSDAGKAARDRDAGVRVVHLELGWDAYEPREGQFNEQYAAEARARLRQFQEADMLVVLGLGIQYPPRWVYHYPNGVYVNQYGRTEGTPNLLLSRWCRRLYSVLSWRAGPTSMSQ